MVETENNFQKLFSELHPIPPYHIKYINIHFLKKNKTAIEKLALLPREWGTQTDLCLFSSHGLMTTTALVSCQVCNISWHWWPDVFWRKSLKMGGGLEYVH